MKALEGAANATNYRLRLENFRLRAGELKGGEF